MAAAKQEMVTLKVDRELAQALKMLPNRSEFIRQAMLKALANACPVCQGTGMLSVAQRRHWDRFAKGHPLVHCDECDTYHLDCRKGGNHGDCQQEFTGKADKNNTPARVDKQQAGDIVKTVGR